MTDTEDDEVVSKNVKITLIGEPSTGKSSICWRYLGGGGGGTGTLVGGGGGSTQGAEVVAGQCLGLRPPVPLQLVDVAGAALHTDMLDNYLYASDIVIFVYDLTNLQSFDKLDLWLNKVKQVFENELNKPLMALFGNKSDLEHQRAVRLSCVQKFASEHLLDTYKGSARTGEMVNNAITSLVARLLGIKVRRAPATLNGKSPAVKGAQNAAYPLPQINDVSTQSLIMNRKTLRKLQRKESSSICSLQ